MILQSLYAYYQRMAANSEAHVAPEGFEWKEIPFVIVLDEHGRFRSLEDTREGERKERNAKSFLVPQAEKRASGIKANLLWDNLEYALGANPRNREDVAKRHETFRKRLLDDLSHIADLPPVKAIKVFLESDPRGQIEARQEYAASWKEAFENNLNVTFRLDGSAEPSVCETLRPYLFSGKEQGAGTQGLCLVEGDKAVISRLHPAIKGVRGTNTSGAAIVSFNLPVFTSFGKTQNYNAPIGESAAFAYTTALNMLLKKNSQNKMAVGDATVAFWAENKVEPTVYDFEQDFSSFFADPPKNDPDQGIRAVRALFEAMHSGSLPVDEGNRFFVLGLAPNAARIAVRFWRTGTVSQFAEKIRGHFDDFEIVRGPKDPEYFTLNQILRATVREYKMDNVPSNLAGAVVESILDGTPYPITLMHQCIRRIRAERHITRARAAILKACINRLSRYHIPSGKEEIKVSLDRTNTSPGYRLGRLFAVLEKIQEKASPGINSTIRDRFYGAASSSPVAAFPQLLKLKNHHLAKLVDSPGSKVKFEKELGEIFDGLQDFPSHLPMEEQARFAIGYYHQRQTFFEKSTGR
jgi:CRISPR-associated protein Csd1